MKRLRMIVCLSAALMLVSGCASDTDTDAPTDTVSAADTAVAADTVAPVDAGTPSDAGGETAWEAPCSDDSDCAAPTDWCAKMPGEPDGYCTIHCANGNADCTHEDWTCNAVGGCDNPDLTWCGPPEEIEDGQGFLVMCE